MAGAAVVGMGMGMGTGTGTAERAGAGRARAWALASIVAVGALAGSGCSSIQPWVKPYEREHLADPIMAFDRSPISSAYLDHLYEVRGAARGASGATGGGCGCN
ncbi:MAG TPA: DUF4266 domain-containing protein [Steroidobacteraceae bacterium]|nr:DUF4266 domain-containing protein [Steroidobacteraceae bacterium]